MALTGGAPETSAETTGRHCSGRLRGAVLGRVAYGLLFSGLVLVEPLRRRLGGDEEVARYGRGRLGPRGRQGANRNSGGIHTSCDRTAGTGVV